MVKSLDTLPAGARGHLVRLDGDRGLRRRLMELGCLPGTPIRLVRRANVGGVLELEVRRSRLTLRVGDARYVLVASENVSERNGDLTGPGASGGPR